MDARSEADKWAALKAKLKNRFSSVAAAGAYFGCHVNSLRAVVSGLCPQVAEKLRQEGLLEE